MGGQPCQLQFLTILLSRQNKYQYRCLIEGALARVHIWQLRHSPQVTTAVVWVMQEAALEGPMRSIEAYSCDLHVLDSVQESQQVTCMTMEDWHQAQLADPTLSLVITGLWDGTLRWWQSKQTDPLELNQFLCEWNYLQLWKGVLYRRARPKDSEETLFSAGVASCTQRSHSKGMP